MAAPVPGLGVGALVVSLGVCVVGSLRVVVVSLRRVVLGFIAAVGTGVPLGLLVGRYLRWFHNGGLRTYVPSSAIRAELGERGFADMRVWPRGVDTRRFAPAFRSREMRALGHTVKLDELVSARDHGVSADFAGKNGMDRAALHNLLRLQMLGNASVGVTRGPLEIQWQGDHATVKCSVLLTGGGGRFLPERAQTYAITSGWREEDGEWRVYYAEWHAAR